MRDWRIAPVLIVRDIEAAVACYREQLGFEVAGTLGEPLEMAFVARGGVQIMLQGVRGKPTPGPNHTFKRVAWDVLLWVDEVEKLHEELVSRGARIRRAPHETSYGHLEIEATDPDGHVICFSQPPPAR